MKFLLWPRTIIINQKKQYTSGLAENSRWRPEMNAKTLKTQYIGDRLTDRREILIVASRHH